MNRTYAGIALLAAVAGCASVSFAPIVETKRPESTPGAGDAQASGISDREVARMETYDKSLPEGTHVVEGELVVDPDRYEVVARIAAKPNHPGLAALGLWPYPYVEGERWRTWYCTPQIPLSWLTLGMWALLSPLHYPCVPASGEKASDVANRAHQLSLAMKKAARAAGGDFLVITGTFSQQVTRTGQYTSTTATFDAIGAVGFAVKRVQPPPEIKTGTNDPAQRFY